MANMGYCRFENTLEDLRDCLHHINDLLVPSEELAKEKLIDLCMDIVQQSGMDVIPSDREQEIDMTLDKAIRDFAQGIAEFVFAPDYYDGPWCVDVRHHASRRTYTKTCTSYSNAKAWADYLQRSNSFGTISVSLGKVTNKAKG